MFQNMLYFFLPEKQYFCCSNVCITKHGESKRFEEQQAARDAGDDEAQMLDRDYVEMLEYGMPPACGWGNSERNFWLLEGVSGREAVPFPLIKHKENLCFFLEKH